MGNDAKNTIKIAVISDIHLLSQSEQLDAAHPEAIDSKITRSQIKKILGTAAKLEKAIKNQDASEAHFVLNGDIFEYIYPRIELKEVTKQAVDFFTKLAERFPQCHFHYIHGNHDHSKALNEQLNQLQLPNLSVHKSHCQIGDVLFTHGDILLGEHPGNEQQVKPTRRLDDSSRILRDDMDIKDRSLVQFIVGLGAQTGNIMGVLKNGFSNLLGALFRRKDLVNEAVDSLGGNGIKKKTYRAKVSEFYTTIQQNLQLWVELIRSPVRDAQIMAGALATQNFDLLENVNHVVTGHTHMPYAHLTLDHGIVEEYQLDAPHESLQYSAVVLDKKVQLPHPIQFHNTGAPLIGAKTNVMMITMIDGQANLIEVDKNLNKRVEPEKNEKKYRKKLEQHDRQVRQEIVEQWSKKIPRKGFELETQKWNR